MAKDKGKRRLTQSRSVAGFKPFILERRTDDDLPQHIKGVAVWKEIEDEECHGRVYFIDLSGFIRIYLIKVSSSSPYH
jgi:hypothetical protein